MLVASIDGEHEGASRLAIDQLGFGDGGGLEVHYMLGLERVRRLVLAVVSRAHGTAHATERTIPISP